MARVLRWIAVVAVVALVIGAGYLTISALFPGQPERDPGIPTIHPYVNDRADALTQYYEDWADDVCWELDQNNSCEVAVLIVNNTENYSMEYYALRTFQYNGLGKEGKDNGVLILVVTDVRSWRIEVGYGLEGILTDTRVSDLAAEYLEPYVAEENYDEGVLYLTAEIAWILVTEYDGEDAPPSDYPISFIPLTWIHWIIIAAIIIPLAIVTRGRIFWPLLWLISILTGGRGSFGGGRSGGGGASGR